MVISSEAIIIFENKLRGSDIYSTIQICRLFGIRW